MSTIMAWLASLVGRILFLPEPAWTPDKERKAAFDQIYRGMAGAPPGSPVDYGWRYPKWQFLRYLVREKQVVLHGSQRSDIDVLRPREQTDYSGRRITAVFGTRDAIWPLFFAVLNAQGYRGSLRNACWVVSRRGGEQRFYFFSVNREMVRPDLWAAGTIYLLPGDPFQRTDTAVVRFDEWASTEPVRPLARLAVAPADFPFLHQVAAHREGESMVRSWLAYKRRRGSTGIRPGGA
ncbi:MAG: hypothetical protein P8129_22665 [Anaerolineae bacterium]